MCLNRTWFKTVILFMVLLTLVLVSRRGSSDILHVFEWKRSAGLRSKNKPPSYVIMPKVKCESVEFILSVLSRRSDYFTRHAIRETWGSYARVPSNNATLIFLLGSEHPSTKFLDSVQPMIDQESKVFGDILQEDYIDSYYNLTLKSISILRWVSQHCPGSKFLLKSDDDMYINAPLLHQTLKEMSASKNADPAFVVGHVMYASPVLRNITSKWYVPNSVFNKTTFPRYTSGPAYAMSTEAAKRLYSVSLNMTYLFLEDVFITGVCAEAAKVRRVNDVRFLSIKRKPSGCIFRNNIAGERLKPSEIFKIHKEINDPSIKCT